MPLIHYLCESNHSTTKFHRQVKDIPICVICKQCGKDAHKMLSAPSSSSKVVVDNGVQARAVEVNLDIIEINKERSTKDFKED